MTFDPLPREALTDEEIYRALNLVADALNAVIDRIEALEARLSTAPDAPTFN